MDLNWFWKIEIFNCYIDCGGVVQALTFEKIGKGGNRIEWKWKTNRMFRSEWLFWH